MIKVGIECESIESDSHGIARLITELLKEIARRPELEKEFIFYLYFKSHIPDLPYLKAPIFHTRLVRLPLLPPSFSIYYYVLLPIRKIFDGLDIMYYTNYMLPLIHTGKSLVFSAHDAFYEARSKNIPFRFRIAYRIFCGWAARHATKLIAMSEFGKQELMKAAGIGPDRILVNHLAVSPAPANVQPHPGQYILFVAQAFPRRHLRETLLAFEKIAPQYPELKFVAIGPDKYPTPVIDDLMTKINQGLDAESIQHLDHVTDDELASYYAGAQAVAYVSSKEAFGLPPLEALAYDTVPVVADNELTHELFGTSGAIFVHDPESVDEIEEGLRQALDPVVRDAVLAHRESILASFTWKAHTDRFLTIIRHVIAA